MHSKQNYIEIIQHILITPFTNKPFGYTKVPCPLHLFIILLRKAMDIINFLR